MDVAMDAVDQSSYDENMTVEDFINHVVELRKADVMKTAHSICESLDQQFKEGIVEIRATQRELSEQSQRQPLGPVNPNQQDQINIVGGGIILEKNQSVHQSVSADPAVDSEEKDITGLEVIIMSGPHKGSTYTLRPKFRAPCYIGRSTGKKYRERGISLKNDGEASTNHAKIGMDKDGILFFADTGSTNGSFIGDVILEEGNPYHIKNGDVLMVGSSDLKMVYSYST